MAASCPGCGCEHADQAAHAVTAALLVDDIDRALDAGLLDCEPCTGCARQCHARLLLARDERLIALAARARFQAREARLARRRLDRERQRASARTTNPAALPPSAAAALARARERAARKP